MSLSCHEVAGASLPRRAALRRSLRIGKLLVIISFTDVLIRFLESVHAVYKQYEPDASLLLVHFLLLVAVPSLPAFCFLPHFNGGVKLSILAAFSLFYFTLATSIVLYRLSPWHPLAKYPGPFLAKISKFWGAFVMAAGKNHLVTKKLHEKYGPYVRIGEHFVLNCHPFRYSTPCCSLLGPNEISVIDISAISGILGADGMPKGPSTCHKKIKQTWRINCFDEKCGTNERVKATHQL